MEAHRGNHSRSISHELLKQINGHLKRNRFSISLWRSRGRLLRFFVDLTTPRKRLLMTFGDVFVTGLALWTNANRQSKTIRQRVIGRIRASPADFAARPGQIRLKNSVIQSSSDALKRESHLLNSDSIYVFTTETSTFVRLQKRLGSSQRRWVKANHGKAYASRVSHLRLPFTTWPCLP